MARLAQFPSPSPAPPHDYDATNGGHDARFVLAHALAKKLPRRLRFLYLCIVDGMWPDDERGSSTWRSLGRIAVDADCSRRTARRGVDELVRLGFLRRDYGGAVRRNGAVVKGSLTARTAKLSFMRCPEQERAQRDARHAERLAAAEANRTARAAEFADIHERRVRLHAAVETGKVPLVDGAAQLDALKAEERALLRACGFTWNLNTARAQRKVLRRTTPRIGDKPRADAQFVRPDVRQDALAKLARLGVPVNAPAPTPGRRERPQFQARSSRWWLKAEPPALCGCGATVVRHPDTGQAFVYDATRGTANPNAPHTCPR